MWIFLSYTSHKNFINQPLTHPIQTRYFWSNDSYRSKKPFHERKSYRQECNFIEKRTLQRIFDQEKSSWNDFLLPEETNIDKQKWFLNVSHQQNTKSQPGNAKSGKINVLFSNKKNRADKWNNARFFSEFMYDLRRLKSRIHCINPEQPEPHLWQRRQTAHHW